MKNKILSILITIFALCACMFTLTACDENEPHTHSYSKEEIAPTCTTPGYNKHVCSCGDIYTDAFISPLGHSFSNYVSNGDGTKTATCDREGCSQTDTITVSEENNQPTETSTLQYTLSADNQGYIVTGIDSYDGNKLIIPSTHKNKPVIAIGDSAFYNCFYLISIEIPDSVTSIGEDAFYNCYSLTSVTIGDSVTSIGSYAFRGCSSLTSIEIPNSVKNIGSSAFEFCNKLIEVYNKSTLNITKGSFNYGYVGRYALNIYTNTSGASKLSTDNNGYIIYTDGSDKILVGYNGSETDLILPNGITAIYNYAFNGCSKLTSVEIPNSVTSIGYSAFENCYSLTSVEIPNSVTNISECTFYYCSSLTSIEIPNSVTSIGEDAFYNCGSLTSVEIPNSVTSIGNSAFYGCYKLVEVYNKSSLNITKGSFDYGCVGCYALDIYTQPFNSKLSTDNNGYVIYTNGSDKILVGYNGSETDLILPNGITAINNYAFLDCNSLTSVVIPNSVTSIGSFAFSSCYSLKSIEIPNSVKSIGTYAFEDCSSLTSVTIGNSVTSIGDYAFRYCKSLTSVVIPDSVTSIGEDAFYYCSNLTSVTIGDSVTSIGSSAFSACSSLTSVVIGNSVTSIGSSAFSACSSLTSVVIGNSVTSIGSYVFYNCSSLTSITFKDTSTWYMTDDHYAWQNKTGGTEIDVSYALSYLTDEYYFYKL